MHQTAIPSHLPLEAEAPMPTAMALCAYKAETLMLLARERAELGALLTALQNRDNTPLVHRRLARPRG